MSGDAVRFSHVWKQFRLGETHDSLGELLSSGCRRLLGGRRRQDKRRRFWALKDIDFDLAHGEAIGIIGPNGAGKSTALKLLAGILRPTRGTLAVKGRTAALIEVGAGFHADLTGRENVFLNGAILGMRRPEIRRKLDAIVAFAGIEAFLDTPVKRYSSGMYARLGFSIAAHVDPEVLLVDEVLSVGDAVFRLRCEQRMRRLVETGTALVFVTHNLEQMQSICPRAIVLDHGSQAFDGPSREAVGHYMNAVSHAYAERSTDIPVLSGDARAAKLTSLKFLNDAGEDVVWVRPWERVRAEIQFHLAEPIRHLTVELNLRATIGENLVSINSGRDGVSLSGVRGSNSVKLALASVPLAGGRYFWNVRMWDVDSGETIIDTPYCHPMVVDDAGRSTGMLCLAHEWQSTERTLAADFVGSPAGEDRVQPGVAGSGTSIRKALASTDPRGLKHAAQVADADAHSGSSPGS